MSPREGAFSVAPPALHPPSLRYVYRTPGQTLVRKLLFTPEITQETQALL